MNATRSCISRLCIFALGGTRSTAAPLSEATTRHTWLCKYKSVTVNNSVPQPHQLHFERTETTPSWHGIPGQCWSRGTNGKRRKWCLLSTQCSTSPTDTWTGGSPVPEVGELLGEEPRFWGNHTGPCPRTKKKGKIDCVSHCRRWGAGSGERAWCQKSHRLSGAPGHGSRR